MRDDFEAKNKQLLDEMPRFYNSRLDYFQPSFESLIRAQVSCSHVPRAPASHFPSVSPGFVDTSHACPHTTHPASPLPEGREPGASGRLLDSVLVLALLFG